MQVSEIKLKYNRVQLNNGIINSSDKINSFFTDYLNLIDEDITLQEKFFALFFDVRMNCIGVLKVNEGGLDCVAVDTRLIYSTAVTSGAKSVIISHNHPSGMVSPSEADKSITHKIKEGLSTLDVKLLDHLILSATNNELYYSFADNGLI